MACNPLDTFPFSPLEKKLIEFGDYIVINQYIPSNIKINEPPNEIFREKKLFIRDNNPDVTISPYLSKVKVVLAVSFILFFIGFFTFAFTSKSNRDFRAHHSLKNEEITEVKSLLVDEQILLENHSKKDPPNDSALFGKNKVNVGDKVGYDGNNEVSQDKYGKGRNFNTPLLIVAEASRYHGNGSSGEKLSIPDNLAVYVYLERDVMTGNLNAPVSAITYIDLKSNGKTLVPKGSRMIGKCQSIKGNRIEMNFDNVVFSDGREYSVSGLALGEDNLSGVAGQLNRNFTKKTGNVFASALLDSASQSMNISGNSFGTIFAGNMANETSDSLDNVIDQSSSNSGASIKIPANTRFKILFK